MIVAKEAALEARKRACAGKGSGRMLESEQRIENKLNADLKHLRAGYFPEERMPYWIHCLKDGACPSEAMAWGVVRALTVNHVGKSVVQRIATLSL